MRVVQSYYEDGFTVTDELPFSTLDIAKACGLVVRDFGIIVDEWPVTVEYNDDTGYWSLYFIRPATDDEYEAHIKHIDEQIRLSFT